MCGALIFCVGMMRWGIMSSDTKQRKNTYKTCPACKGEKTTEYTMMIDYDDREFVPYYETIRERCHVCKGTGKVRSNA